MSEDNEALDRPAVVYLFGAGATHGSAMAGGTSHGTLMSDLTTEVADNVRSLVSEGRYADHRGLVGLVNSLVDDETDIEQLITFLANSPSARHREFAEDLREAFENTLRSRLKAIDDELDETPVGLYTKLFDMYEIPEFPEILRGCLTINYDLYIEKAVGRFPDKSIDFGITVGERPDAGSRIELLKLHGSFDWEHTWPIKREQMHEIDNPLWIPPGIHKTKEEYPFDVLWGRARELLDCDILRIVGCNLGPNDWDLMSLLFTTRHVRESPKPYRIEVIDSPEKADELKEKFPYLEIRTLLDVEEISDQLISEYGPTDTDSIVDLDNEERTELMDRIGDHNWFRLWLTYKIEGMYQELGSVETRLGAAESLLEG